MGRKLPIQTENPKYTSVGALPTVEEQSYWERLRRYGRTAYGGNLTPQAIVTTGSTLLTNLNPNAVNKEFVPFRVEYSATVDSLVYLVYQPLIGYDVYGSATFEYLSAVYVKAYAAHVWVNPGHITCRAGGTLRFQATAIGSNGTAVSLATGVEVAVHD